METKSEIRNYWAKWSMDIAAPSIRRGKGSSKPGHFSVRACSDSYDGVSVKSLKWLCRPSDVPLVKLTTPGRMQGIDSDMLRDLSKALEGIADAMDTIAAEHRVSETHKQSLRNE